MRTRIKFCGIKQPSDLAYAEKVNGRGGGRDDLAEAGGLNTAALDKALAFVPRWVSEHLDD